MQIYDPLLGYYVEQVDEMDVVFNLIKSSNEFNYFYSTERMEKLGEVSWRIDPKIGPIMKMRAITIKNQIGLNYPIIYMNNPYISIEDVFIVAHEIMHCVLTQEGNSLTIYGNMGKFINAEQGSRFVSQFQTMLEDSVVDTILQNKYNLNPLGQYLKSLDLNKKEKWSEEPKEKAAQIYMSFNITNNIMKWEIIKDRDSFNEWIAFLEMYRSHYPNVLEISNQILSIIDEVGGLESIEQKKSVFFKITEKYNLEDILTINPPSKT